MLHLPDTHTHADTLCRDFKHIDCGISLASSSLSTSSDEEIKLFEQLKDTLLNNKQQQQQREVVVEDKKEDLYKRLMTDLTSYLSTPFLHKRQEADELPKKQETSKGTIYKIHRFV